MVNFDTDGVTLFYIDATGEKIAHGFMDGEAYAKMLDTRSQQLEAKRANDQAAALYNTQLADAQAQVNAGRPPATPPAKPLARIVADDGTVTYGPFTPPLGDLLQQPAAGPSMTDQILAARAANPDPAVSTLNGVKALVTLVQAQGALLAKIAAKLGVN